MVNIDCLWCFFPSFWSLTDMVNMKCHCIQQSYKESIRKFPFFCVWQKHNSLQLWNNISKYWQNVSKIPFIFLQYSLLPSLFTFSCVTGFPSPVFPKLSFLCRRTHSLSLSRAPLNKTWDRDRDTPLLQITITSCYFISLCLSLSCHLSSLVIPWSSTLMYSPRMW